MDRWIDHLSSVKRVRIILKGGAQSGEVREGGHAVAWQSAREGKTDSEKRIKIRERKQDAKELLPETPCGSFVYNEVSDLHKEVPSGF